MKFALSDIFVYQFLLWPLKLIFQKNLTIILMLCNVYVTFIRSGFGRNYRVVCYIFYQIHKAEN